MDAATIKRTLRLHVSRAKATEANYLYSTGGVWKYLKGYFGCSEAVLTRVRASLHGTKHTWPDTIRAQRRYVLRRHYGEIEELCYEVKEHQASRMYGSVERMRRYLRRKYCG
jgi:hypothetical protein